MLEAIVPIIGTIFFFPFPNFPPQDWFISEESYFLSIYCRRYIVLISIWGLLDHILIKIFKVHWMESGVASKVQNFASFEHFSSFSIILFTTSAESFNILKKKWRGVLKRITSFCPRKKLEIRNKLMLPQEIVGEIFVLWSFVGSYYADVAIVSPAAAATAAAAATETCFGTKSPHFVAIFFNQWTSRRSRQHFRLTSENGLFFVEFLSQVKSPNLKRNETPTQSSYQTHFIKSFFLKVPIVVRQSVSTLSVKFFPKV